MNTKSALAATTFFILLSVGTGDYVSPGSAATAAATGSIRTPQPPEIASEHRRYLMRIARRTIVDVGLGRAVYEPSYAPEALSALELEAIVRLREGGFLFASAYAGPMPVVQAVRDAARFAAESVLRQDESASDLLADPLIEIELVGSTVPIPIVGDWTRPRAVDDFIEPGVHGLALEGATGRHRFCPTELITSGMVLPEVLGELARRMHAHQSELAKTELARFRTLFFYQATAADPVATLHRGMTIVSEDDVTRSNLDSAIERLAEYLVYRQLESGLFTYLYDAATDRYSDDDNVVRQVGAALAICTYASQSRKSAARASCNLALRHHLRGLRTLPGREKAAFIETSDGENKLGVTALLALALASGPDSANHNETRQTLVKGILALQRASGMFVTAFPPALEVGAQDYFPGEALLALADYYHDDRDSAVPDAFDKAIGFYRNYFHERPSPAFVPWQVQAFAAIAPPTQRADYVAFVFELTDWLIANQITQSNNPWPEMSGGIASYQPGRAGIATASYLESLCDALAVARASGDGDRAVRYERAVRSATRFVLQLQIRPEEAYFMRSPRDAFWGMRTSPALNLLRIDHVQHALMALIKARSILYTNEP